MDRPTAPAPAMATFTSSVNCSSRRASLVLDVSPGGSAAMAIASAM